MSDTTSLIHRYVELWNEHDPSRRKQAIVGVFASDGLYTDPEWDAVIGPDAIEAMIGQAQAKFGDLRFAVDRIVSTHHDLALFTWRLGLPGGSAPVATGYDVAEFDGERVRRLYGFFD